MAAVAARLRALPFLSARTTTVALTAAGLGLLALVSLYLRTQFIGAAFWIDEGLSVGIAQHALTDIPGILKQDGSPPLYYMTLHVWMSAFGSTEQATQSLSLVFALLSIPAAFWAAGRVWGRRAAWFAAFVAALMPYLTGHGQETRMYALMSLLSILATGCFLRAYVLRDRRFVPVFGLALAAMLYTHNWALFFAVTGVAIVAALIWRETDERRGLIRDGLIGFGIAALAYAPWLPTLVYQSQHTAAPWSNEPGTYEPTRQLSRVLGGYGPAMVLAFGAGLGIAALWQRRDAIRERKLIAVSAALVVGIVLLAWIGSQVTPAWTNRYFAVVIGPLVLLGAGGVRHATRGVAIAATILLALFWFQPHGYGNSKASERTVMTNVGTLLEPGDLLISTHPERLPVLSYYGPEGLQYATTLGRVTDPGVMDWRDALPRLQGARVDNTLEPLLDTVPVGGHVLIVRPIIRSDASWRAPWTSLVRRRSAQWDRALAADERFGRIDVEPNRYGDVIEGVRAKLYTKIAEG
jgi:4-amino-4-deoxy-L-arabinose transferase-like glycosyltransferase